MIILLVIYLYTYRVGIQYFLTWSSLVRQFFHSMKSILLFKTKFPNTLALSTAISYQDAPLKHFQRVHLSPATGRPVDSVMTRVDIEK